MFRRFYHCSCVLYNKKQGVKLCKMLSPRNKKQWYPVQPIDTNSMPSVKSLTKIKYEPGKRGIRRVAMLNKLFMKNITDIMSTGTVSMQVVGRGIEISKVTVTPDFKTVNVFWVCKGDMSDEETNSFLHSIAGPLRHELSTLRLMGEVPYIVFVKDRKEAQLVDLDRRLAMADYGEDYIPTEMGHLLKTDFMSNTKLSPEMKAKIRQLEDELPIIEEPLPEMTHNVFDLDHEKIMNRLLAARKRTKEAWDNIDADAESNLITYRASGVKGSEIDVSKQKKELAEFLMKRQILQNKLHKKLRDERATLEAVHDEQTRYYDEDEEIYDEDYYEDLDDPFSANKEELAENGKKIR
ncbi:putative ribosome-binding factor A, mitochondrial [Maniola hyperantus]|uniref:putative ribosome-binding factor A, mitochondrial n=1 Tax=Aphantopus hyperantus TaxID=2795564 RepID=UPI001567ED94|nr:putative ribosome-binding factor A, mitochondrial isoform X1 [Maniola hyperantus]